MDLSWLPPPEWGFIFCFVFSKYKSTYMIRALEVNLTIHVGAGEGKKDSIKMRIDYGDLKIKTDLVCLT